MLITIERQARSRNIPVTFVSRRDVNRAFVGFETNKYEVVSALAKQFPSLASRLPPKLKCWQSEDYRMGIFDAAASESLTSLDANAIMKCENVKV